MVTPGRTRALIIGCAGLDFTPDEARFIAEFYPYGLILFRRNIAAPEQVRGLARQFRSMTGRALAPVMIDQEGGRVARLGPPHWPEFPPAGSFGCRFDQDPAGAMAAAHDNARAIADVLRELEITHAAAPVLDLRLPGMHDIIGDRAFGADPAMVAALGRSWLAGLNAGGVHGIIKHVPGHGRATLDSHEALPVVEAAREVLLAEDGVPFRALAHAPFAMTAHITYTALDADRPATLSASVMQDFVRGALGLTGLIMTDDLSMKALSGTMAERGRAALAAGCDVLLHCNGAMEEMRALAAVAPVLEDLALRRAGVPPPVPGALAA